MYMNTNQIEGIIVLRYTTIKTSDVASCFVFRTICSVPSVHRHSTLFVSVNTNLRMIDALAK